MVARQPPRNSRNVMTKSERLRALLDGDDLILFAGCYDALGARIAEQAGFHGIWISGYGVAASMLGSVDIGLVTLTEMADRVRQINGAVDLPVIADAEVGFGNALNVVRSVREFQLAGAVGIQMGDEATETCPFLGFPTIILEQEEAELKIRAARETGGKDLFITSAPQAGYGRALSYARNGASAVFVRWTKVVGDSPDPGALKVIRELRDMGAYPVAVTTPFQPPADLDELKDLGYRAVVVALDNLYASAKAQQDVWAEFMKNGSNTGFGDKMFREQDDFLKLLNEQQVRDLGARFLPKNYQMISDAD